MAHSTTARFGMVAALVMGLWLAQVGSARACTLDGPAPPRPTAVSGPVAATLAVPAVIDAALLAFQLGYGDQMLPQELAIVQIVLGSTQLAYSTLLMAGGLFGSMMSCTGQNPDTHALLLGGFIGTFLSSWLIADGVASVQVRRHRARQELPFVPTASVSHEGFMVGLGGSF
jgi:hypothetical protein